MEKTLKRDKIAYDFIKDRIISGEYSSDYIIDERKISKLLDISTTPVKNALKFLEKEQFVTIKPRKKTVVKPITLKLIKDLFQMRTNLEYVLIKLTIINNPKAILEKELLGFRKNFEELKKQHGFNKTYNAFRFFFAQNCGNKFMSQQMITVYEHIYRLRVNLFHNTPRRELAIDEQIELIDEILKNGDGKRLKKLVDTHIEKSQIEFFSNLNNLYI